MDISQSNWNETDANNNTAPPDGFPFGMPPSGENTGARAIMGAVKRWWNRMKPTATDGSGTSTAYTLTYAVAPAGYVDGETYLVRFDKACGNAPTLNVMSLGAIALCKFVGGAWVPLAAGDISAAQVVRFYYDQTSGSFWSLYPLGTAAQFNVGTGPNNVVQLDINGQMPSGLGWSTGDVKSTYRTTADAGWVMMNDGSIGDASSSATTRANADTSALFTLLWTNLANAQAPVSGDRGVSAAADFAAHKTITLPLALGRALAVAGAGSGLTSRALGSTVGEETHTLTKAEIPPPDGDGGYWNSDTPTTTFAAQPGPPLGITSTGYGGGAHNNMQPSTFLNVMIKL